VGGEILSREFGMECRLVRNGRPTEWAPYTGAVREELLYQGGADSEMKIGYREFRLSQGPVQRVPTGPYNSFRYIWQASGFHAASSFYQQLEYDKEEGTTTIVFKKYRVRVLSANNEQIRYVVESEPLPTREEFLATKAKWEAEVNAREAAARKPKKKRRFR